MRNEVDYKQQNTHKQTKPITKRHRANDIQIGCTRMWTSLDQQSRVWKPPQCFRNRYSVVKIYCNSNGNSGSLLLMWLPRANVTCR